MRLRMLCGGWGLICLATLAITPASADIVTYSTAGVFTSSGNNVLSGAGGLTITYTDTINNVVVVPPTSNASFGTFTVAGPTSGSDAISDDFKLTITQTTPTSGHETLTDTFKGTIVANGSTIKLTFTGGTPIAPVLTANP